MTSRLRELGAETRELEARIRQGGGAKRIQKQHEQGKLTARERVERLDLGRELAKARGAGRRPGARHALSCSRAANHSRM